MIVGTHLAGVGDSTRTRSLISAPRSVHFAFLSRSWWVAPPSGKNSSHLKMVPAVQIPSLHRSTNSRPSP
jgi:hypothetical protein